METDRLIENQPTDRGGGASSRGPDSERHFGTDPGYLVV
jgi:hypothetical protein